jgi:hypothetical protein
MAVWNPDQNRYWTYDEAVAAGIIGAGSPYGMQSRATYEGDVFKAQNPPVDYTGTPYASGPAPSGLSAEQQSAKALITSTLDSFGLKPLGEWMWQEYMNGVPLDAIWLSMRSRDEYKARFPGMAALQGKGRAITEAQYIDLERQYSQILHANGIPSGIFDQPDQLGRLIGGETSPAEFNDRMNLYAQEAAELAALPENRPTLNELERLYGIHPNSGSLIAYIANPNLTLPVLTQQFKAADISSYAVRSGYGGLSRSQAENLVQFDISPQQAAQGFATLSDSKELFNPLIGEKGDTITQDEQFNAVFGANNAALERIRRQAERRRAQFTGGGGFAAGQQGISGLGSAG